MNIKVKRRKERFAIVPTSILENTLLSWKSKGLISYLLSRPDDWTIRVADLVNRSTDGRDATKSALKELRLSGYAQIIHDRNDRGHIIGSTYLIHEIPIETDATTERRKTRPTEKPSDGKPVDIIRNNYNKNNYNKKEERKAASSNASLFNEPTEKVLKKYIPEDSFLLRLPGQPSSKVVLRWLEIYEEEYLQKQFLKAEKYFKNKKNSAKKIKSLSRTLNEFLKKEWISDQTERNVLKVFREYWIRDFTGAPMSFDLYQTSDDRRNLSQFCDAMKEAEKEPVEEIEKLLNILPEFWKGKKLNSILKNFASINKESKNKEGKIRNIRKESSTVQNMDWLSVSQN